MANPSTLTKPQTQTLIFNGLYILVTKKRVKNINLRIDRQGVVKMSVPLYCSIKVIHSFINDKESWIKAHIERINVRLNEVTLLSNAQEGSFYLGKIYPFKLLETQSRPTIRFEGGHFICSVNPASMERDKQQLLNGWQRSQMSALLPDLIMKWEPILGVHVNAWGIRVMTTRWGSCNTLKKRIWLNLSLIQKPLACLEYVVLHEMVHLLEPSHNSRFYTLMDRFMPEWKHYKNVLNGKL